MPALSPTMQAGNIGSWQKKAGDSVAPGDVLVEIETDKAQMDFEFQEEGVIAKILKESGEKDVAVGSVSALVNASTKMQLLGSFLPLYTLSANVCYEFSPLPFLLRREPISQPSRSSPWRMPVVMRSQLSLSRKKSPNRNPLRRQPLRPLPSQSNTHPRASLRLPLTVSPTLPLPLSDLRAKMVSAWMASRGLERAGRLQRKM